MRLVTTKNPKLLGLNNVSNNIQNTFTSFFFFMLHDETSEIYICRHMTMVKFEEK